jgi:hypothetical protein
MSGLKNGEIPQLLATEYASYRDGVVRWLSDKLDEIAESRLLRPLVFYDPMAGTAPLLCLAERHGFIAYFNDLNALHSYINGAKRLQAYQTFKEIGPSKLLSIVYALVSKLDGCKRTATKEWIERPVLNRLASAWKESEGQAEYIRVLIKAVLLLSIRAFSSFVRTENPTWLKPGGLRPRVRVEDALRSAVDRLDFFYRNTYGKYGEIKGGEICLTDYDATRKEPGCKVDVVMTSPPFCNRVDWDRIYAPEHFFLEAVGVRYSRIDFLGTSSVRQYADFDSDFKLVTERSQWLCQFLNEVKKRQLRKERESNYYVKYFTRYFAELFHVFDLAASMMSNDSAGIYFVVQGNRHRGLDIEIGIALQESLRKSGFDSKLEQEWEVSHMGLRNVSKRYKSGNRKQVEAIWHAVR